MKPVAPKNPVQVQAPAPRLLPKNKILPFTLQRSAVASEVAMGFNVSSLKHIRLLISLKKIHRKTDLDSR